MGNWISIATFSDRVSAESIAELLRSEAIPVYITSDEFVPGLGTNFSVAVAPDQARRARWFLQQSHVSEQELTYLATGERATGDLATRELAPGDPATGEQPAGEPVIGDLVPGELTTGKPAAGDVPTAGSAKDSREGPTRE